MSIAPRDHTSTLQAPLRSRGVQGSDDPTNEKRPPTLRRNAITLLVANAISTASQWAILALLTKQTSTEAVGIFTLGLAITAPVFMFFNLDLRALIVTNTNSFHTPGTFFRLRTITATVGLLVSIAYALLTPSLTATSAAVIATIATVKFTDSLSDIRLGLLQRIERMDLVASFMSAQALATAGTVATILIFRKDLLLACAGMLACHALSLVLLDRKSKQHQDGPRQTPVPRASIRTLFLASLPLGGSMLLISLQTNIPRLFIESYASVSALGIFAALAYPWALGSLLVKSVGSAAAPRYRRLIEGKRWASVARLAFTLSILCVAMAATGVLIASAFGSELLNLLYTAEYAEHATTFVLLGISAGFGYISAVLRHALVALRQLRSQFGITVAATLLQVGACAVLIPSFGLNGAAFSAIAMSILQMATSVYLLVSTLKRLSLENPIAT